MGARRNDRAGGAGKDSEIDLVTIVEQLVGWFDRNARDLPWRKTLDPYAVWVSEIMLQQTQVQTVIPYWTRWMERLSRIHDLAEAPPELVLKLWEGLGYYSRARNLQRAARQLVEEHGGRFPREAAALLALPGIGRYTAGAIASIALDQPEPILDGNILRVLTRLAALEGDPRKEPLNRRLWETAASLVQAAHSAHALGDRRCSRLNQSLMELGATVCTPGARPDCARCPVSQACEARRHGCQERFPELAPRVPITPRFFATAILVHEGRHLLTLREDTGVNQGFWEFPNWETPASASPEMVLGERLGIPRDAWSTLPDLRHHITRYRMVQRVRLAHASPSPAAMAGAAGRGSWLWATQAELESLPLTSAHRKLALRLPAFLAESPQLSGTPTRPTLGGK